ncbi:thioredoxin [Gloeomargarita lithophora Alchichica-D10]|uniref:Thioredoxin n=1 Tax=Gloeomargarita lithophora Alchichica-D10 TaxID=1188229 RepID=A0A1J0AAB5_9CYAN|nr:thioredoxin domain-containing protein [Gloeomargarita lithophora]APB32875.1 thioredoxin [Gloeomargarita lithophora Alchichica-D10]
MKFISEADFTPQVLQANVPVVVHFSAPWCGLCRLVEPLLAQLQEQYGNQMCLVGVNADESLHLSSRYRLRMLPTLLVIQDGQVQHRVETFQSRDQLYQQLHQAVEAILTVPTVASV